ESAGQFDPMYLAMGFDALVLWRASNLFAGQSARISWRAADGEFQVTWHESGDPAPASIQPSVEVCAGSTSPCMAHLALALPLLARIMTAHSGKLHWSREPQFHALLSWPLDQLSALPSAPEGDLLLI